MNKDALYKAMRSAALIALPVALISLLVCTFLLGSGIFEKFLPLCLTLIFAALSFAAARIPYTAKRLWLRITIPAAAVTIAVISLCLFCS